MKKLTLLLGGKKEEVGSYKKFGPPHLHKSQTAVDKSLKKSNRVRADFRDKDNKARRDERGGRWAYKVRKEQVGQQKCPFQG